MQLLTRTNASTTRKTWRIFVEEMKHEKRQFITAMVAIPLTTLFSIVLIPLFISFIIQTLIENPNDTVTLTWLMIGMTISSILAVIVNQVGFNVLFKHQERVTTRLTECAITGLLAHSQNYFANQKVGSLAGDVNTFSRSYLAFFDIIALQVSGIAVSYISSLVVVAFIAPTLLLPLSLLTAFIIWHSMHSMQDRAPYRNKRKELQSRLVGQFADVLGNQTLVRLFGRRQEEIAGIVKQRQAISDIAAKEIDLIQANAKIRQAVLFSFQIITILIIIGLFRSNTLSIGAVVFAITYLARITGTMFNITSIIRGIEQAFLDAAKITEMLQLNPEIVDAKHAKDLVVSNGEIEFSHVTFRYPDTVDETVFEDVSLNLSAGEKIGLVGKSGGGKTTLTSLLLRYNNINDGSITIDGQNIASITQGSLRAAIAYVPQDPFLFHRTLRENIAYGKPDASDDEIRSAAKKAHALEFIEKLPAGFDTIVGERGVKLSGGQRQRIAIARAIIKDAPILILDEATSALDSESEHYIQSALHELMHGRTSIVIAHRLSTIARLDRIIVLDDGKIIEDGTHAELLEAGKTYAKLWKHQSGGFIDD